MKKLSVLFMALALTASAFCQWNTNTAIPTPLTNSYGPLYHNVQADSSGKIFDTSGFIPANASAIVANANATNTAGAHVSFAMRPINCVFGTWIIGDNAGSYGTGPITNTTGQTNFSYRMGYLTTTNFSPSGLSLAFGNPSTFSLGNQTDLTIRASIEYPSNTFRAVYFQGKRDVTISPDGRVWSDRIPLTIPTNTQFWVRTYGRVIPGNGTFILKDLIGLNGFNGGGSIGTGLSDQTMSGTIADLGQWGYGADAIVGYGPYTAKSIGFWGDSIMSTKSIIGATSIYHNPAIEFAVTNHLPSINASYSGSTEAVEKTNYQTLDILSRSCSHVIVGEGINGLLLGDSQLTISNDLQTIWNGLAAQGVKVYQATITPHASSTDSFVTTNNQTGLQTSIRAGLNDWIRTCPSPLSGYIDIGSQMETATNSNIFKANGTAGGTWTDDGLHPDTTNSQTVYINIVSNAVLNVIQ